MLGNEKVEGLKEERAESLEKVESLENINHV